MADPLLVLGAAGLLVAVLEIAAFMLGRHIRRTHDAKYFPKDGLK